MTNKQKPVQKVVTVIQPTTKKKKNKQKQQIKITKMAQEIHQLAQKKPRIVAIKQKTFNNRSQRPSSHQRKPYLTDVFHDMAIPLYGPGDQHSLDILYQNVTISNEMLFPSIQHLINSYDIYEFTKLEFVFIPASSQFTSGQLHFAFDPDPHDSVPTNVQQLRAMAHSQTWSLINMGTTDHRLVLRIPPEAMRTLGGSTKRFTDSREHYSRETSCGTFYHMTDTNTSSDVGSIEVRYQLRLYNYQYAQPLKNYYCKTAVATGSGWCSAFPVTGNNSLTTVQSVATYTKTGSLSVYFAANVTSDWDEVRFSSLGSFLVVAAGYIPTSSFSAGYTYTFNALAQNEIDGTNWPKPPIWAQVNNLSYNQQNIQCAFLIQINQPSQGFSLTIGNSGSTTTYTTGWNHGLYICPMPWNVNNGTPGSPYQSTQLAQPINITESINMREQIRRLELALEKLQTGTKIEEEENEEAPSLYIKSVESMAPPLSREARQSPRLLEVQREYLTNKQNR